MEGVLMKKSLINLSALCLVTALATSCGKDDQAASNAVVIKGSSSANGFASYSALAADAGSPTSMKMSFYALAVSKNEDCSAPTFVFNHGSTPVEVDLVANPTLFSGALASGTYKCLIMRVSDNIKFKADATAVAAHGPNCANTTTEYTHDVYRSTDSGWKDMNGVAIPARGAHGTPVSDIVDIFVTTSTSAATAAGIHPNQTIDLSAALVVPGTSTFFADFNDGINVSTDGTSQCVLESGGFGFR
jgi:hypothetical protein